VSHRSQERLGWSWEAIFTHPADLRLGCVPFVCGEDHLVQLTSLRDALA
jgi:hypothetical protein